MKNYKLAITLCFLLFSSAVYAQSSLKPAIKCNYLLYLPEGYNNSDQNFPLLVYLHGKSHRGNDLNKLKGYGLPRLIDKGNNYAFIIASPQCPDTTYWARVNWFDSLYSDLTSKYRIDPNRIYLTGISMGGYGSWQAALDFPDRFAAIVPLCGGCSDSTDLCSIKDLPVWTFHGTKDNIVPIHETEYIVERLKKCGSNVRFTRIENAGHDITSEFENKEIYDWLIQQKKY